MNDPSASLARWSSLITRNESAKKTLNKIGLKIGYKIEPLGIPKSISTQNEQLFNV